jgi:hypothetical protein
MQTDRLYITITQFAPSRFGAGPHPHEKSYTLDALTLRRASPFWHLTYSRYGLMRLSKVYYEIGTCKSGELTRYPALRVNKTRGAIEQKLRYHLQTTVMHRSDSPTPWEPTLQLTPSLFQSVPWYFHNCFCPVATTSMIYQGKHSDCFICIFLWILV